jgi:MFS superfamily sulfate permease-like transporter
MVQVLTEAGWSQLAFDHCWRASDYFAYIMLFFCFMHITIVYIIATLIRGVFWEVFFTVNTIYLERKKLTVEEEIKENELNVKTK